MWNHRHMCPTLFLRSFLLASEDQIRLSRILDTVNRVNDSAHCFQLQELQRSRSRQQIQWLALSLHEMLDDPDKVQVFEVNETFLKANMQALAPERRFRSCFAPD